MSTPWIIHLRPVVGGPIMGTVALLRDESLVLMGVGTTHPRDGYGSKKRGVQVAAGRIKKAQRLLWDKIIVTDEDSSTFRKTWRADTGHEGLKLDGMFWFPSRNGHTPNTDGIFKEVYSRARALRREWEESGRWEDTPRHAESCCPMHGYILHSVDTFMARNFKTLTGADG